MYDPVVNKAYRARNKERIAKYKKKYDAENKEKIAEYMKTYNKEYMEINRDFLRKRNKETKFNYEKKGRDELSDVYIKRNIVKGTTLKHSDIPQDMIELKRLQLKLKRGSENGKDNK